MSEAYQAFLASKAPRPDPIGCDPDTLAGHLFDFQAAVTEFACRQGRAGVYLDTGLGKSAIQIEWSRIASEASNGWGLIWTPLAVARQMEAEAHRFGYEARVIRDQTEAGPGINICNYDRADKIDPAAFGSVSLDEASILKAFNGRTRHALTEAFRDHRFKLCCTATPAPNDHMELGQQCEFLGVMASNEMLARWFVSDQTEMGRYRLKGHAHDPFWDWMASWSRMAERPEDLGFDGSRFVLPELIVERHRTIGDVRPEPGSLFAPDVSATTMFDIKRQTTAARADLIAEIVSAEPAEPWVIWCDTNAEADAVLARLGSDAAEVRGSHAIERKEEILAAFATGQLRRLITKPSITGFGVNWQHCARMAFVGRSFSYEAWYQAVRRCWRFGQTRSVHAHVAVAQGEDQIGRVIDRKAEDHAKMKAAMAAAMRRAMGRRSDLKVAYQPKHLAEMPAWLRSAA